MGNDFAVLAACISLLLLPERGQGAAAAGARRHVSGHRHAGGRPGRPGLGAPFDLQSLLQTRGDFGGTLGRANRSHSGLGPYSALARAASFVKKIRKGREFENLCINGKQVPELFVAGVVKAATTSFSNDLQHSPNIIWPYKPFYEFHYYPSDFVVGNTVKEAHFMDEFYYQGRDFMLESFPACRADKRVVGIESSPRYFMDPLVPSRIALWYGDQYKGRLKFVILVRDAIKRFHSDYWHGKQDQWCINYTSLSFLDVVNDILGGNAKYYEGGDPGCSDRLEASIYRKSLIRWFSLFAPRQFTIVPYKFQTQPGAEGRPNRTVAEHVWETLGLEEGMPRGMPQVSEKRRFNVHPHPPLDEDLPKDKQIAFAQFLAEESSAESLANLFTVTMPGANLYKYGGSPHDEAAVAKWLRDNW